MSDTPTYRLRNAIFDLDGTLVDSAPDIRTAIAQAYAAVGIACIGDKIAKLVIGPPLAEILRYLTPGLADEQFAALTAAFRQAYDNSPLSETKTYPGVEDALRALRQSGAKLLVATNKPALAARRVLAKTGIEDCFLDLATPDTFPCGKGSKAAMIRHLIEKWQLEPEVTFVFGDAVSDMRAAAENGVGSVAILGGYGNREELIKYSAHSVCRPSLGSGTRSVPDTLVLELVEGILGCGQFNFR